MSPAWVVRTTPIPDRRHRISQPKPPQPRRWRDVLATIPLVLIIPILVFPMLHTTAGGAALSVSGNPTPGAEILVVGTKFHPKASIQLTWDGSSAGMPAASLVLSGTFQLTVTVPATAAPGPHTLAATATNARGVNANGLALDGQVLASTTVVVIALASAELPPTTDPGVPGSPTPAIPVPPPVGGGASPSPTATTARATAAPTPPPATAIPATPAATPAPVRPASATPAPTPEPPPVTVGSGALYVSPQGNDSHPGTIQQPLRSVARALSALRPGMTLYLRGGTYAERITNPSIRPGTSSGRITVTNYPGERPVIQGLLWLKGAHYWTLNGINVTWGGGSSSEHMVKMTDGVGWVISRSEFWGARSYAGLMVAGTVANEPAGWQVVNNCIHDTIPTNGTNQDHNMYVNTGLSAGSGVIAGNLLFNAPNGENIKLGGSDSGAGEGSANVVVRSNTLYNAAQPILLAGGTHHVTIERNLIVRGTMGYLVRGYQLSGAGNVARSNLGYDATKLFSNDSGYVGVGDGGGNIFPHNPRLEGSGCGLATTDATAMSYGR
jgi:hypothetical protein